MDPRYAGAEPKQTSTLLKLAYLAFEVTQHFERIAKESYEKVICQNKINK